MYQLQRRINGKEGSYRYISSQPLPEDLEERRTMNRAYLLDHKAAFDPAHLVSITMVSRIVLPATNRIVNRLKKLIIFSPLIWLIGLNEPGRTEQFLPTYYFQHVLRSFGPSCCFEIERGSLEGREGTCQLSVTAMPNNFPSLK